MRHVILQDCGYVTLRKFPNGKSEIVNTDNIDEAMEFPTKSLASEFIERNGGHGSIERIEYCVMDWAGNEINTPKYFDTFEDAWGWIRETFPDEEDWQEYYVERIER